MGGVQAGWGGEKGNGEMSVHSMGEMGKDLCPNVLQTFSSRRSVTTLSLLGGSFLGVPCRCDEKVGLDPHPKEP